MIIIKSVHFCIFKFNKNLLNRNLSLEIQKFQLSKLVEFNNIIFLSGLAVPHSPM